MVDGNFENPLNGLALHDTAMTSIQLSLDRLACMVEVEGSGGRLAKGERVVIACQDLHSFFASFNFAEMQENVWPGNVQDGRCDSAGILRVYLTGGMLEAGATNVALCDAACSEDENSLNATSIVLLGYEALCNVDFDFGFLQGLGISLASSTLTASVLMRVSDASSELVPAVLSFSRVRSCILRLDVTAMKDSVKFGNIRAFRVNVRSGIVWMYCREGFVEIVAEQVVLRKGS